MAEPVLRWLAAAALAWALALSTGCDAGGEHAVWVASFESHCGRGDLEGALRLEAPSGAADVVALRQDARFSLGMRAAEAHRWQAALEHAERGLRVGTASELTLFRANLHMLRGTALEALARPEEAVIAYERAQIIHHRLYQRAVAAHRGGAP